MADNDLPADPTAKILSSIFHELESLGHDRKSLYQRVGIDTDNFSEPLLSASDHSKLFNYACCLLSSETSSHQPRNPVTKNVTDMLLYCVITCKDLAEVIERTSTYCSLVESIGIVVRLVPRGSLTELRVDIGRQSLDRPALLLTAAAMSTFYHLFSWITATNLRLTELGLRYQKTDIALPLDALQGQSVRFDQSNNYFIFPSEYLSLPVARSYQQLTQVIDYFPVNLVVGSSDADTCTARVSEIICASFSGDKLPVNLDIAGQLLNLSSATLRRRLKEEGSSFSQILMLCQQVESEKLLKTTMPIKTIALQLGFSDDRAFRRAFKRWTQQTPTAFREKSRCENRDSTV